MMATKAALTKRMQEIANNAVVGEPLIGERFNDVLSVLAGHPDWCVKEGSGISNIVVKINQAFGHKATRGFWILRTDGTETDISWRQAISPSPHYANVRAALRFIITDQIKTYRMACLDFTGVDNQLHCHSCGMLTDNSNIDVDHKPPHEFQAIVNAFMDERHLLYSDITLLPHQDGDVADELEDKELAKDWQEWHRKRAELWLICKPCHKQLTAARKGSNNTEDNVIK